MNAATQTQTTTKFNQERLLQVLLAPVISEKGTYIADKYEQVIFRVMPDATKPEIKAAVEALFSVKVKAVNTSIRKGKVKRFRQELGTRKDVKKAVVTLVDGQSIDISTGI